MINSPQNGDKETLKTQPQSDTKPAPQQDQGGGRADEKKPQQQS